MVHGGPGGIGRLCDLLDEYGDEVEADFTQFYNGLDVAGVWRGEMTPRRALVLAGQLMSEPGSRYRAALLGAPEFIGWGPTQSLLAGLFDATQTHIAVAVKAAGGKTLDPPHYPRPQPPTPETETVTIDNFPIWSVVAQTTN